VRGEAARPALLEQEFTQLKPVKRRGNRRYYQHHEVLLIRRIRELLYEEGFTISGARQPPRQLADHEDSPSRCAAEPAWQARASISPRSSASCARSWSNCQGLK